jgi:FAD/FMN-containing dehydrogenase
MRRRTFLLSTAAAAACATVGLLPALGASERRPKWDALRRRVGQRLIDINSPLVESARNGGAGASELFSRLKNPYYLSDEPSLTQSLGWIDAWTSQPSLKGVAAESASDVASAVDFARQSGIAPVIKGGGHSYFGNSNRAGSLLIWTHRMRTIDVHDSFRGAGWPADAAGVPAVSLGAGCLWGEVYRAVSRDHGRYVQGGGCLTVGTAGFVQGGGFGSLSKQFGTGAANLLEAELVTADGHIRTVNRWRDPELFFALRGGGGGTFGVVTRMTLKTHPLPSTIGAVLLEVTARDESSWRALIERMIGFYAESLFNPNWGEQIRFSPGRRLGILMVCHSLTQDEIARTWNPFVSWIKERAHAYVIAREPVYLAVPGRDFWDPAHLKRLPGLVLQDDRPASPADNIYWASNRGEAAQVLHAYQSQWLPNSLLQPSRRGALTEALVRASDIWTVTLHCNKSIGGGSSEALSATRETAMNPQVLDSFALVICAAEGPPAWPGIPGHEPDIADGRRDAARVTQAMQPLRALLSRSGSYMSESDYFERDWKRAYWGGNYPRLAATKRRYDPDWLFRGHHCVEPA